jgi:hypothetical protein
MTSAQPATPFTARLGSIYLSATPGTPVGKFDFLVDRDHGELVQIGTAVAADTREGVVVGAVVDMKTVGEAANPIAADFNNSYDVDRIAQTSEVMVATVQVMHSASMRPVRAGLVRAATPEEMLKATGFYDMKWAIPAGVVPLVDGRFANVCFDGYALLGPESSHMSIGGLSGVAAKSSFTSVLMRSAIQAGDQHGDSVAALVFNVKGEDLIWLDQPPAKGYELTDEDLAIYEALGVSATPFEDVTVYAPAMPAGGRGTRSPRPDAQRLSWDLPTIWQYLRFFFGGMDWFSDQILQAFLSEFKDMKLNASNPTDRIDTFKKLAVWMDRKIAEATGDNEDGKNTPMAWRGHHLASFRRFKRMLCTIPSRAGGLVTTESSAPGEDIPVKGWAHGQVVVVDIAGLTPDIQGVVIARTLDRLMRAAEEGELGVEHLIVSFDELNNFAPSTGSEMGQVRKALERVASMGRYLGISLFGAGQALSKVAEQVTTNAASRALGRTSDIELSSGAYGRLSAGLAERIATLPKGQMCLWHYSFRAPLVVRFPRPAWKTGKAKSEPGRPRRPKTTDTLGLRHSSLARLTEGIHPEQVAQIVDGSTSSDEALAKLQQARVPDMNQQVVKAPASTFDPNDPFDIGEL